MAKRFFCGKKKNNKEEAPLEKILAERIEELKRETLNLSLELAKYRAREAEITNALSFAQNKAKELEQEAKIRYALERERLENYRAKWTGAIQSLEKAESLGEQVIKTEKYLRQCAKELKDIIERDIPFDNGPQEDYYRETARLSLRLSDDTPFNEAVEEAPPEGSDFICDEELERMVKSFLETTG